MYKLQCLGEKLLTSLASSARLVELTHCERWPIGARTELEHLPCSLAIQWNIPPRRYLTANFAGSPLTKTRYVRQSRILHVVLASDWYRN